MRLSHSIAACNRPFVLQACVLHAYRRGEYNDGEYPLLEPALRQISIQLENFVVKKQSKDKDVKNNAEIKIQPGHQEILLSFYRLLYTPFLKSEESQSNASRWTRVKFSRGVDTTTEESAAFRFLTIHQPAGFDKAVDACKLAKAEAKATLIVADSDYGAKREPWDQKPWETEFEEVFKFGLAVNGDINLLRFAFFVADHQLVHCLSSCEKYGLKFALFTWAKNPTLAPGHKIRRDTEHLVMAWQGGENTFVNNIDAADQPRYSTLIKCGRISKFYRDSGRELNKYQKPLAVMTRILEMTCPRGPDQHLVIDVTCGSGTTAVMTSPSCFACMMYYLTLQHDLAGSLQVAAAKLALADMLASAKEPPSMARKFRVILIDKVTMLISCIIVYFAALISDFSCT